MSNSIWQNAEFGPLQSFSVGKWMFFPLQINGAGRLGRMLLCTSLFGQDPGIKLSAAGSSQSSTGHGSSRGERLTQPSWKPGAHRTWLKYRASDTAEEKSPLWISSALPASSLCWSLVRHNPARKICGDQSSRWCNGTSVLRLFSWEVL